MKNPQGILFVGVRRWTIEVAKLVQDAGFRVLMLDSNYEVTSSARMAGLPSVNANVLSEYASEEIDLVGIGNMVASTPNDQVNTLACINLGHSLGASHVFQLQPVDHEKSERQSASAEFNGRLFGNRAISSAEIEEMVEEGAVIKKTTLNEEFSYESFLSMYGEDALVLFRITDEVLKVETPRLNDPSKGDVLISLVFDPSEKLVAPTTELDSSGPEKLP
jgi:Trk K+ transport system NAD-binding subunit